MCGQQSFALSAEVWKADELKFSLPVMHQGRYILVMMGFFAVRLGLFCFSAGQWES